MPEPDLRSPTQASGFAGRIWIAQGPDLATAAKLLGEFRDWFGYPEPTDDELRRSVERIAAGGDGEYLLAATGSEPRGVLQLRYRWSVWKSADDAWIEDVFVRESARRGGLGRALVEAAIERARERGCRRIELDVDEDNLPARALYRDLGFAEDAKAERRSLLLGKRL